MSLKFKCHVCGGNITVKYLKVNEVAVCKICGAKNVVPESAEFTGEDPDYTSRRSLSTGETEYSDRERFIAIKTGYDSFTEALSVLVSIFIFRAIGYAVSKDFDELYSYTYAFIVMIGITWLFCRLIDCIHEKKPKAYDKTKARRIVFDKILKKMDIIGNGRMTVPFDEIKKIVCKNPLNTNSQKGDLELVLSNNTRIEISGHNDLEVMVFTRLISELLAKPVEYDMDIQSYRKSMEEQIFSKAQEKIHASESHVYSVEIWELNKNDILDALNSRNFVERDWALNELKKFSLQVIKAKEILEKWLYSNDSDNIEKTLEQPTHETHEAKSIVLKFKCQTCGKDIIVKFLKIGETAKCRICGGENVVPDTAIEIQNESE